MTREQEGRFWGMVVVVEDCWEWAGTTRKGYGRFRMGRMVSAHRASYEHFVGPVPEGMTLDHVCGNPRCVKPAHLVPATVRANVLRSDGLTATNARKSRCVRGHELSGTNLVVENGHRRCVECRRLGQIRRYHHA